MVHPGQVYGGHRPTLSYNAEVWAHSASKGGSESGQFVYSRWLGWCTLGKYMRGT